MSRGSAALSRQRRGRRSEFGKFRVRWPVASLAGRRLAIFGRFPESPSCCAHCRRRLPSSMPTRRVFQHRRARLPQATRICRRVRRLCLWAFDLLHLNGKDLLDLPLVKRRAKLQALMERHDHPTILFSAPSMIRIACSWHARSGAWKGIVSKRIDAPYRSGNACGWFKVKCAGWREANKERWRLFEKGPQKPEPLPPPSLRAATCGLPHTGDAAKLIRQLFSAVAAESTSLPVTRAMPTKTITCRDCGLLVRVLPEATGTKLDFDFNDWRRRCKRRDLGGPAWCFVLRPTPRPKTDE